MRYFNKLKKSFKYYQQNIITCLQNESTLRVRECTLRDAHARVKVFRVQLYKNNARALLSRILSILNSDWLQHVRSVRGVYEQNIIDFGKQRNHGCLCF